MTSFPYKRHCRTCGYMKPMNGAITWPKFICQDCRNKPKPIKNQPKPAEAAP